MVAVLVFILTILLMLMSASCFVVVMQNIDCFMDVLLLITLFVTFVFSVFMVIGGIGYFLGY